ncbi:MAG TPA: hypothetical protein VK002_15345 [Rubricoccaceae bacterium]|nr:hypothetical protein [Rubricoccaceae bacterium]
MFFDGLDTDHLNAWLNLAGIVLGAVAWGAFLLWVVRKVRMLTAALDERMGAAQAYADGIAAGKAQADEALVAENARMRAEVAEMQRLMTELSRRMGDSTQAFIDKLKGG